MRTHHLLIATVATMVSLGANAQGIPQIEWQACYGGSGFDSAQDIVQTSDGGYVMIAQTTSSDGQVTGYQGSFDFWVVRISATGELLWQRAMGGSGTEFPQAVIQSQDGGYVVAGSTYSIDGDVVNAGGSGTAWVIKLNSAGSIEWQWLYGRSEASDFWSLVETQNGVLVLAGETQSSNTPASCSLPGTNAWLVKLSSAGELIWERCYGGSSLEAIVSVVRTPDNGYVLAGESGSSDGDLTSNNGASDVWVVKVDEQGDIAWQRSLGGSQIDKASAIKTTADGGYAVVGSTSSSDGDVTGHQGQQDIWIIKLDSNGQLVWQRATGGTALDIASGLVTHADGGITVAGWTDSSNGDISSPNGSRDAWLVRLNAEGTLVWERTLGGSGSELFNAIIRTADNGFAVAGRSASNDGDVTCDHVGDDVWLVKLSAEPVGVAELVPSPVRSLYPNPVQDVLTIELLITDPGAVFYTWLDVTGRVLAETRGVQLPVSTQQLILPTAGLPHGPLLLQVQVGEQRQLLRVVKI